MERLTVLLPQLISVNQVLIEMLSDRDDEDPPARYMDGSLVDAKGAPHP